MKTCMYCGYSMSPRLTDNGTYRWCCQNCEQLHAELTRDEYNAYKGEVLNMGMDKIDKLKAYEDAEMDGLIVRLPIAINTPVLMVMFGNRGYYLITILFDLPLLREHAENMIFTNIKEAHERLQELNAAHKRGC